MLGQLKRTASHTLIYSLGNISTKIVGLLLLPLYTSKLSLLDYGRFTILEVTMMFLSMVLGLRIASSMMRWSAETNDLRQQGKILFNTYFILIINAVLINFVTIPLRPILSKLFFDSNLYSHFFTILFAIVSLEILNQVPMNLLRFRGKPAFYSTIFIAKLTVILGLNFYFLVKLDIGIIGIFYSQLIANALVLILTLPLLYKNFTFSYDFALIGQMLHYSFPLIFSAISVQVLAIADRFIIKQLLDYSEVGIYSLGSKIAGVLNVFVIQAFALGFLPIAYKMLKDPEAARFYRKIFKYLVMILVFVALGISLFSREILSVFARQPEFLVAHKIVPIITLAFVFKGMQYMFMLGFHYVKKTKYIAYIVSSILFVNIGLNYLLIPIYGIWGAALATVISSFLIAAISYKISERFYPVHYEIGKATLVFLVGGLLYCIASYFSWDNLLISLAFKILICAIFPLLLYLMKFFETTELQKMGKVIARIKK